MISGHQIKALDGIRVLDLSRILAGPLATQILADFGAEVIKIEKPGEGDDTRRWGPPFMPDMEGNPSSDAAYFHCANRNKKSVTVDIATTEGQQLIRDLAEICDVLVENFKVDGLKKYGLDYGSLSKINPRLVYCSVTGFGQTGPYANRAGYDFMVQGMGGLMSITGEPDGSPMKAGVALSDVMTGLYTSNAIQTALLARHKTGKGQHIDISLLDCTVSSLANQAMNYQASGDSPERLGNAHPNIVPYEAFETKDSFLILAIGNDRQFADFCDVSSRPDLKNDERFLRNADRVRNRQILVPQIKAIMKDQSSIWWIERFEKAGIPCGPVNDLKAVFSDPQVNHRELIQYLPHSECGITASVANPVKLSATPATYQHGSPVLGEHTREVLQRMLQLSDEQLDELSEQDVI